MWVRFKVIQESEIIERIRIIKHLTLTELLISLKGLKFHLKNNREVKLLIIDSVDFLQNKFRKND